jgi:hypothetical protein
MEIIGEIPVHFGDIDWKRLDSAFGMTENPEMTINEKKFEILKMEKIDSLTWNFELREK